MHQTSGARDYHVVSYELESLFSCNEPAGKVECKFASKADASACKLACKGHVSECKLARNANASACKLKSVKHASTRE